MDNQKENDRLNIWYKNVKLQLENKQIDCDRSDKERDELQGRIDELKKRIECLEEVNESITDELVCYRSSHGRGEANE